MNVFLFTIFFYSQVKNWIKYFNYCLSRITRARKFLNSFELWHFKGLLADFQMKYWPSVKAAVDFDVSYPKSFVVFYNFISVFQHLWNILKINLWGIPIAKTVLPIGNACYTQKEFHFTKEAKNPSFPSFWIRDWFDVAKLSFKRKCNEKFFIIEL